MPSFLTKRVFRCLISDRPLVHAGCLRRNPFQCMFARPDDVHRSTYLKGIPSSQCRHFLDLGVFGAGRKRGEVATVPGIEEMTDLAKRLRVHARLPPRSRIAEALSRFLKSCSKQACGIEDAQASLAFKSLEYCMSESGSTVPQHGILLSEELLELVAEVLVHSKRISPTHVILAKSIYEYSAKLSSSIRVRLLMIYCHILSQGRNWEEAVDVLTRFESQEKLLSQHNTTSEMQENITLAWMHALSGVSKTGNLAETLSIYQAIQDHGSHDNVLVSAIMLQFYQRLGDVDEVRRWWARYIAIRGSWADDETSSTKSSMLQYGDNAWLEQLRFTSDAKIVADLLAWCQRRQDPDFGNEIIANLLVENPPLRIWNTIFVWAAANGKGVDGVDRMIEVMQRANCKLAKRSMWRLADITTINALVEHAMQERDPYMAERFISMGHRRGIEPDHRTFSAQMNYRLDVGDTDGALSAYKSLQSTDSSHVDWTVVNKLIVSLCRKNCSDFDTIMNVAADLSDRRVAFEAETVSELMKLHLSRDEMHDVVDLLSTHSLRFSLRDRAMVTTDMLKFCTSSETTTTQAWETYNVLREFFDEISRETRTAIMRSFFGRDRPDIAVHIFNHMRNHSRADTIATGDTYVTAFLEIAKLKDVESLEVIHNQLKLDYNVESDTSLRTALMIAYSACDKPRSALQIWDDVVASREGPSYKSVHVAFRACELSPFGTKEAHTIWKTLQRKNVDLESSLWASYVSALAAHGQTGEAMNIVEQAVAIKELDVDVFLLGSLCVVAPDATCQDEIERWAQARFPKVWDELTQFASKKGTGLKTEYSVDRNVTL